LATDSNLPPEPPEPDDGVPEEPLPDGGDGQGRLLVMPIEEELKGSYLTYAMSVIVSRALPDARDGLKPSQRRILVAMNDLNLTPGAGRVKCAKISGDTSGNYHPHGESVIYPTLVRMAQEWNMRCVLVDKQGNFGSIAGLPPAAMRYTEARMSPFAALMLEDLKLDTVDYAPTYDERNLEPTVLPSKFPNLLVNGSQGIAVGMATSIPPHNLAEICDALIRVIDEPDVSIDELLEIVPGPDFPTGGVVCGRAGIRRGYHTGRSTVVIRARTTIEEYGKDRHRIVVHEIPYQQARDRVEERIAALVNEGRIAGISATRNESDLKEPVRLILELKRDADPEVVLNQLYQFSPLQDTFSLNFLALVDGKPRVLNFKELLEEFLRHRETVVRRRTLHLLAKARQRKHTVEGLLLALAEIEEVIRVVRTSRTQEEAKRRLVEIQTPAAMLRRALGDEGFAMLEAERGSQEAYALTPVQADAILRLTLGQLVNLEQEKLAGEHRDLLERIREYNRILSDRKNILDLVRDDLRELKRKYPEPRRTDISGEEIGNIDVEDLIAEETMVVSISSNGYIKRTPVTAYRAQHRGGKGLTGAKTEEEDPIEHLFVASTHSYLMFFTNLGKVYWRKVYDLPQLGRGSRGRAVVNLLSLQEGERITDCRAVRDFDQPDHYLVMATARGLVKKTPLQAYCRPRPSGIIAIKLRAGDQLVDVCVAKRGDELLLATAHGMAIRFRQSDARAMGRGASGVKGIRLAHDDQVVGMVVADPAATLLTACANGYGKRTFFGPNLEAAAAEDELGPDEAEDSAAGLPEQDEAAEPEDADEANEVEDEVSDDEVSEDEVSEELSSQRHYRTQRRGGKGLRDIKTTPRNGPVIGIARVGDGDELLMITARGKIQRIPAGDISIIGRNTQGVKIMSLDEGDTLVAVKRVPQEESGERPKDNA
jgi:DNA gyrase subunit A